MHVFSFLFPTADITEKFIAYFFNMYGNHGCYISVPVLQYCLFICTADSVTITDACFT